MGKPRVEVLKIGSGSAFEALPALNDFFLEGLATHQTIKDLPAAMKELQELLDAGLVGAWIATEDMIYTGLLIAQYNYSALGPHCGVIHVYNKGSRASRDALMDTLREYAKDGGFDTVWGFDVHSKPQAFARVFSRVGKPVFSGAVVAFKLRA